MKLAIGASNCGAELKETLVSYLNGLGHEVTDLGTFDTVDAAPMQVAEAVRDGKADGGILIDACGAASAIIANKVPGIIAAQVGDSYSARLTKQHNRANILCFGAKTVGADTAKQCVLAWLTAEWMEGNHPMRPAMIRDMEKTYCK